MVLLFYEYFLLQCSSMIIVLSIESFFFSFSSHDSLSQLMVYAQDTLRPLSICISLTPKQLFRHLPYYLWQMHLPADDARLGTTAGRVKQPGKLSMLQYRGISYNHPRLPPFAMRNSTTLVFAMRRSKDGNRVSGGQTRLEHTLVSSGN